MFHVKHADRTISKCPAIISHKTPPQCAQKAVAPLASTPSLYHIRRLLNARKKWPRHAFSRRAPATPPPTFHVKHMRPRHLAKAFSADKMARAEQTDGNSQNSPKSSFANVSRETGGFALSSKGLSLVRPQTPLAETVLRRSN